MGLLQKEPSVVQDPQEGNLLFWIFFFSWGGVTRLGRRIFGLGNLKGVPKGFSWFYCGIYRGFRDVGIMGLSNAKGPPEGFCYRGI